MSDQRSTDQSFHRSPMQSKTVKGDRLCVQGRELVPLVQVTGHVKRRAALCSDRVSSQGYGFVRMKPVAVLDNGPGGQRRHQIRDGTIPGLRRLLAIALLVPCLSLLATYLLGKADGGGS